MSIPGSLNEFDLVVALTQKTINDQLKTLFQKSILPQDWNVSLNPEDPQKPPKIHAEFSVPRVNLVTGEATSRKAELIFPIQKGTFSFWQLDYSKMPPVAVEKSVEFAGAQLKLTVNLSIAELAAKWKSEHKKIPEEVKKQLEGFSSEMFRIDHLFLNFEDVNLLDSYELIGLGDSSIEKDPNTIQQFKNILKAFIDELKGSENPFILGYSVNDRKTPENKPEADFTPTGTTYSVFPEPKLADLSSLNYLLMTANKAVPSSGGAGLFNENWVDDIKEQGAFVISQNLVLNNVLPALAKALESTTNKFKRINNTFVYDEGNNMGGKTKCTVSTAENSSSLKADFCCSYKEDVDDKAGSKIGYVDGDIRWTTSFRYSLDSHDIIKIKVQNSKQQITKNIHKNFLGELESALASIVDGIVNGLSLGLSSFNFFSNLSTDDWNDKISVGAATASSNIKARIILPAGDVFDFTNLHFKKEGHLVLDIAYKD